MSCVPHEPTEKNKKTVEAMSSYGIKHEDIAKVIGIDEKTLRKYYRFELDTATAKANSQVAQRLYQKCLDGDTSSMIFWLKTRARWSETVKQEIQHLDSNGDPADVTAQILALIPNDQLEKLINNASGSDSGEEAPKIPEN